MEIWRDIGYPAEAKNEQLRAISVKLTAFYNEMLNQAKQTRDQVSEETVADSKAILTLRSVLGLGGNVPKRPPAWSLLQYKAELRRELRELRTQRDERILTLRELVAQHESLSQSLGDSCSAIVVDESSDLSQARIDSYKNLIFQGEAEKKRRGAEIKQLIKEIQDLYEVLQDVEVPAGFSPVELASYTEGSRGYGLGVLQQFERVKTSLTQEMSKRTQAVQNYASKIKDLWLQLGTPEEVKNDFFNQNPLTLLTPAVLDVCKMELERLQHLKLEHNREAIKSINKEISELCEKLHMSEAERIILPSDDSDSTLEKSKQYLSTLKEQYEIAEPVFKLIIQHEKLLQQQQELELRMQDPHRLLDKKNGGLLLREEQLRNSLRIERPRVEKTLEKMLRDWQQNYETPFKYNGEDYLNVLQERKLANGAANKRTVAKTPQKSTKLSATPQKANPTTPAKGTTPMKGAQAKPFVHQATPMKLVSKPSFSGTPLKVIQPTQQSTQPAQLAKEKTPLKRGVSNKTLTKNPISQTKREDIGVLSKKLFPEADAPVKGL
eukprot:TRINITY_DN6055_c0_g1_i1.p1 TRINITY_DN6055_c0_g1~~TRINITY_DN6055_c0_g1_i1.p1  ORF type:complete len:564 (-),score=124.10 TRINITY_DN6055_c0_g1_i1:79-1731(-)